MDWGILVVVRSQSEAAREVVIHGCCSLRVSCGLSDEKEGNETSLRDSFHDIPSGSPTLASLLMFRLPVYSFSNPNVGPQP